MNYVFKTTNLNDIKTFDMHSHELVIVERKTPIEACHFFEKMMVKPFKFIGKIHKESALIDLKMILICPNSFEIYDKSFYEYWLNDMAKICEIFCDVQNSNAIGFCLTSKRECSRYHVDNVSQRLLVTYAGKGTEWLSEDCADRDAYFSGSPNEKIIKEKCKVQFVDQWNVALFRGAPNGLLHRSPDDALYKPSILMRLDHESYWDSVIDLQKQKSFN